MQKKGWEQAKHELKTLQGKIPTGSPRYGGYCIKYKQRRDGVKFAVSNTSNIDARFIEYERFPKLLRYQIQAMSGGDVGGRWKSGWY